MNLDLGLMSKKPKIDAMSNLQISIFVIEDIISPVNFSNKPSNDLFVKLNSQDKKKFCQIK